MTRRLMCFGTTAICSFHQADLFAATISLGPQIVLTSDLFVVPIRVTGGTNVTAWAFDLRYDPLDVQVNTACDPFGGDVYCSFTGPVTEGEFFASGSPFNVWTPGFVDLDSASLAQTGLLFGVNGTFGGPGPGPSGDGVLAYVEFLKLGTGSSALMIENTSLTQLPSQTVPEPGSLLFLTAGVLLCCCWRWFTRMAQSAC